MTDPRRLLVAALFGVGAFCAVLASYLALGQFGGLMALSVCSFLAATTPAPATITSTRDLDRVIRQVITEHLSSEKLAGSKVANKLTRTELVLVLGGVVAVFDALLTALSEVDRDHRSREEIWQEICLLLEGRQL